MHRPGAASRQERPGHSLKKWNLVPHDKMTSFSTSAFLLLGTVIFATLIFLLHPLSSYPHPAPTRLQLINKDLLRILRSLSAHLRQAF